MLYQNRFKPITKNGANEKWGEFTFLGPEGPREPKRGRGLVFSIKMLKKLRWNKQIFCDFIFCWFFFEILGILTPYILTAKIEYQADFFDKPLKYSYWFQTIKKSVT